MRQARWRSLLAGVVLGVGAVAPAAAVEINGSFSMVGGFSPSGGSGGLGDATGIDFLPLGPGGAFAVSGAINGDFVPLVAVGNVGLVQDFTFALCAACPIPNFFTINGIAFDLTNVSVESQSATFLTLAGTGTFHVPGFDDTAGAWNFSAQTVAADPTFSWSASTGAPPPGPKDVPEPGSLSLLGLGAAVFAAGVWVRKRR